MSRIIVWLCLLLAALPVAGQDQPRTYSIAGTVVQSVTRATLPRTTVHLIDYQDRTVLGSTLTSPSGEFRFSGLSQGKYSLRAEHNIHGSQGYGNKIRGALYGSAVAVGPGLDSENLVFELIPGGVIKGIVRDADSDPAPRIRLLVFRLTGPLNTAEAVGAAQSNDLGAYRLHGLPQGRYVVAAAGTPWNAYLLGAETPTSFPLTFHPGTTNLEQAAPIDVVPGVESQADISMTPTRAVNLIIRVPKLNCSARNSAMLTIQVGNGDIPATAYRLQPRNQPAESGTEPVCSLHAGSVTPGRYVLTVASGFTQLLLRTTVQVDEGRAEIEVPLTPPATVNGRLTINGSKINPPMVFLRVAGSQRRFPARVQADGTFRFDGVPAYTYEVLVGDENQLAITAMHGQGAKMAGGSIVIPETGKVELNLTVDANSRDLTGRVLNGGKPSAGVFAILAPKEEVRWGVGLRMDQTDSDGTFRWHSVAPGNYLVFAVAEGTELDYQHPGPLLEKYADRAVALTVQPGSNQPVELDLPN